LPHAADLLQVLATRLNVVGEGGGDLLGVVGDQVRDVGKVGDELD
jgi:hypothetical protein